MPHASALLPRAATLALLLAGCGREPSPGQARASGAAPAPAAPPPAESAVGPPAAASDAGPEAPASARPRLLELGASVTGTFREPRRAWRLVDGLSWQPFADDLPKLPPEPPAAGGPCPAAMILVAGGLLLDPKGREDTDGVMFAQNAACTRWRTDDRGVNGLCDSFDRDAWLAASTRLPREPMRFCVDRYEFPGAYGEYPLVVVTFAESEAYCAKAGKRLCSESEWTLACEGEEGRPYPYGYERDPGACPMDILARAPDDDTFKPRFTAHTASGVDLAFQGRRSGESPRCASPFGVMDMTGNVDEWTRSVRPYGYRMIMKGGHWGPGRHRCRPQTRGHGPHYLRYDQGFRCCKDEGGKAGGAPPSESASPDAPPRALAVDAGAGR